MFSIFATDDFESAASEFEVQPRMIKIVKKAGNKKKLKKCVCALLRGVCALLRGVCV